MTLTDLLTAVAADTGYEAIPSAVVTARLTRYLNEAYHHVLSLSEMGPLRSGTLSFRSTAGLPTYGFPQALVSIEQMVDTTNNIRVRLMTADEFRTIDPQEVSSGTPTHYVPVGYGPIKRELPAAGSPVFAVSSQAGDITQLVSMLSIRRDDLSLPTTMQSATLNGITRVPIGTFTDYVGIRQLELSAVTTGAVSFYESATAPAGTELAIIAIGQKTVQYQQLRLWPTPAAEYLYSIDGIVQLEDLALTYDIPLLPTDFHSMLADYARWREYEYRDDSRAQMARAQFQEKLKSLRDRVLDPPDYRPRVGRIRDRSSNLGSYYPPGRW